MLAILLFTSLYFFQSNKKAEKRISILLSRTEELQDQVKELTETVENLENEKDDLEEQLANVSHFDNGSVGNSVSSSGVSYTGSVIQTSIDGEFQGWEGETIFKMMDGSIWQQSSYAYMYHYAYSPEVIIYNKSGTTYMKVEDVDDEIEVRRIK